MASAPVTVLMPVYNREEYVGDAIRSILSQTYADFEFLIINDGSTDNSREIIASYSDERIKVLDTENKGWASALRTGVSQAKGRYIARMDSDDISLPKRLEQQNDYLDQNPNVAFVHSLVDYIDPNGELIRRRVGHCFSDIETKWHLLWRNVVVHPAVMLRSSVLKKHNLNYLSDRYRADDFDLWNRLARVGDIHCIPEVLLRYRIHGDSATRTNAMKAQFDVYRDVIKDNWAAYGKNITRATAADLAVISSGTQIDARYYQYDHLIDNLHIILSEIDEKFRLYHGIDREQLDAAQASQLISWARYMLSTSKLYAAKLLFIGFRRKYS
ncbi:MAG: glycosyltransferase, partial [Gammaproteobacteria bacterium]|nr:glycosyltransferase [Gammaproteobacteria bacterium]